MADIEKLLASEICALGYELAGCELLNHGNNTTLRLFIDKEAGIRVEDCEKVSRQVSALLDVEDPIATNYTLEVSSPGLNRRLFKLSHYQRFVGSKIRVKLSRPMGVDKRRKYEGILTAAEGEGISVEVEGEVLNFLLVDIDRANVVPDLP